MFPILLQSEYSDEKDGNSQNQATNTDVLNTAAANDNMLIELTANAVDGELLIPTEPTQLSNAITQQSVWSGLWPLGQAIGHNNNNVKSKMNDKTILDLTPQNVNSDENITESESESEPVSKTTKSTNWMDLFAELDPLANPEAFDLKLSGGRLNAQQI